MIGKTAKITVYVLAMIFFASTILPAVISENFVQTVSETEPLFGFKQTNTNTRLDPFIIPEEPKVSIIVEKENGEEFTVEVPEDIEKEALEEIIEEEFEDEPIQSIKDMEEENILGEEAISEAEKTLHVAMHSRDYRYFLEGYFFCEIGQEIKLDASDLYTYNTITKYEWDFNGDGTHDLVSSTPSVYHSFNEIGLYYMRVKITYSYNYTYYQYSNRVGDNDNVLFGDYDSGELSFTTVTKIKNIEYETRVSVGSEEDGYPPILDFDFRIKEEPEPVAIDDIDTQAHDISLPSVQPSPTIKLPGVPIIGPPIIIEPPTFYRIPIQIYDPVFIYNQSKTHVQMVPVTDDIDIIHIPDCVVEFDASKTIDLNEESEFSWDFGDGSKGEGEVISHTYTRKGTYTATLRAKGWYYEHTATFTTLRGYGEPKVAFLSSGYGSIGEDYLFCRLGDTMIFDMTSIVSGYNLAWVDGDFDCDGIYEENSTSPRISKTFLDSGYYEVHVRYTYSYESYPYYYNSIPISYPLTNYKDQEPITYYNTIEYLIKVAVANEENIFPPIPYFYVKSSSSFSWWTSTIDYQGGLDGITLKNTTYLRAFSDSEIRLNSWNSSIDFNANSTFDMNTPKFDSFTYRWDFGDGTSGSGIEVTHVYANSNIDYEVKLTVSNGLFESSTLRTIRPRPYSPNIYLYREKPGFDTVRVIVDGMVTKAVPEVELGSEIMWENVWIEGGKLHYNGKSYDFLYYEELIDPKPSKFGWILERDESGSLFLNDEKMTLDELKEFFRSELKKTGLYDNEIEDFVEEWIGEGGRLFPGETVFRYAIMYVPENIVDGIIQVETEQEYNEIIRVHFLVQPAGKNLVLEQPKYPEHRKGENVLHEWGVYTDNTVVGEEENLHKVSTGISFDSSPHFDEDVKKDYFYPSISYLWLNENRAAYLLLDSSKIVQFANVS